MNLNIHIYTHMVSVLFGHPQLKTLITRCTCSPETGGFEWERSRRRVHQSNCMLVDSVRCYFPKWRIAVSCSGAAGETTGRPASALIFPAACCAANRCLLSQLRCVYWWKSWWWGPTPVTAIPRPFWSHSSSSVWPTIQWCGLKKN